MAVIIKIEETIGTIYFMLVPDSKKELDLLTGMIIRDYKSQGGIVRYKQHKLKWGENTLPQFDNVYIANEWAKIITRDSAKLLSNTDITIRRRIINQAFIELMIIINLIQSVFVIYNYRR